tara:strand:- start:80 stop:316 length:237 start_codon:yes stop_codon:yes gene_type:complete
MKFQDFRFVKLSIKLKRVLSFRVIVLGKNIKQNDFFLKQDFNLMLFTCILLAIDEEICKTRNGCDTKEVYSIRVWIFL